MPAKVAIGTASDLVVAKCQRLMFASHLADCELGPMKPRGVNEKETEYLVRRNAYLNALHELRLVIANRLI
jgi:hypothetical protein